MDAPLDPSIITTRAEAEAHVRLVGRTCRGPANPKHRAAVLQLLADGRAEEASAMDDASRRHPTTGAYQCGADINDVICAGPFDGQVHEYTCKRCGVQAKYGAPEFPALVVASPET